MMCRAINAPGLDWHYLWEDKLCQRLEQQG